MNREDMRHAKKDAQRVERRRRKNLGQPSKSYEQTAKGQYNYGEMKSRMNGVEAPRDLCGNLVNKTAERRKAKAVK